MFISNRCNGSTEAGQSGFFANFLYKFFKNDIPETGYGTVAPLYALVHFVIGRISVCLVLKIIGLIKQPENETLQPKSET